MSDLIERDAAIAEIIQYGSIMVEYRDDMNIHEVAEKALNSTKYAMIYIVSKLPAVQPERKTGKWKKTYLDHEAMGERPSIFYCSACNQCIAYPTNYCPACGAKMEV